MKKKEKMIDLKRLTPKSMSLLKDNLEKFHHEKTENPEIDINKYDSEEIKINDKAIEIDQNKKFDNKLDVGKYFLHVFPREFKPDVQTWNWLSLVYYKQLLNDRKRVGDMKRLFVSENYSYYPYRHLLKAPYDICKLYQDNPSEIKFLLKDRVNINGVLYQRISENQDIRKNRQFVKIARHFFYDEKTRSLKKDITGSIQRLIKVWKQYERSFDMYRMPSDEVIQKLLVKHDEFKKFV